MRNTSKDYCPSCLKLWATGHSLATTTVLSSEQSEKPQRLFRTDSKHANVRVVLQAFQESGGFTMGVALEWKKESYEFTMLAEQIVICLLKSYCPDLIIQQDEDMSGTQLEQALSSWDHSYWATIFNNIADQAFKETGWQGFVGRASSGAASGLNVQTPYVWYGAEELLMWTKTEFEHSTLYRRTPKPAVARDQTGSAQAQKQLLIMAYKRFGEVQFTTEMKQEYGLKVDTIVQTVVEIVKQGTHPHAWTRLQAIGPWDDWDLARRVAIRIEWQNKADGKWWTKFIYSAGDAVPPKYPLCDGHNVLFARGVTLWRFFNLVRKQTYANFEKGKGEMAFLHEIKMYLLSVIWSSDIHRLSNMTLWMI